MTVLLRAAVSTLCPPTGDIPSTAKALTDIQRGPLCLSRLDGGPRAPPTPTSRFAVLHPGLGGKIAMGQLCRDKSSHCPAWTVAVTSPFLSGKLCFPPSQRGV